ncbi:type I-F CRISPR-associated protein Csy3 [Methyloprofundus sp.]|uniref:type I-F CRISPR-associated protein Csy3 n=1 Tax=Methyloprofundus sp. TaxID=2020875 RepID=UPI003D0A7714
MSKIPASVLAFEKKLVPSDGLMYGTTWEGRNSQSTPLKLQEKSVRGTISNRLKKSEEGKIDAKIESANLQTVDSCALTPEQDTLKLNFTLKVLSGVEHPSACNHEGFNQTYTQAVTDYIKEHSFTEIANRYASNLANGSFFWRNRVGCEMLEVKINVLNNDSDKNWTFNSLDNDTQDFSNLSNDVTEMGSLIAKTLSGENEFLLLEINAFAKVGKSQDVYPSEELVLDKNSSKEKKSKILYHVNDVAAMHSQKIGNAIRTIDTWYPDFDTHKKPIAIDPYGAVTNLGRAYRQPKQKIDFFSLFDRFSQAEKLENVEEEHFVMAVLVRGGVFGEKQ